MFDCGRAVFQQLGTASSYGVQLLHPSLHASLAFLSLQALPERDCDRAGHALSCESGKLLGQFAGLFILDVQAHEDSLGVDMQLAYLPYRRRIISRNMKSESETVQVFHRYIIAKRR